MPNDYFISVPTDLVVEACRLEAFDPGLGFDMDSDTGFVLAELDSDTGFVAAVQDFDKDFAGKDSAGTDSGIAAAAGKAAGNSGRDLPGRAEWLVKDAAGWNCFSKRRRWTSPGKK